MASAEQEFFNDEKHDCVILQMAETDLDGGNHFNRKVNLVRQLALRLNGVTILKKGLIDIITNGKLVLLVRTESALKRCGGQGDLLSGSLGTFVNFPIKQDLSYLQ